MLQAIRDRATGWIAYGIVGFLVIPFAFWGIDQYQGGGQVNVAEVEGTDISLQEFQRGYQQRQARLQAVLGDRYDPALMDESRLKRETLDELVNARLMTTMVVGEGYRIGDEQLARAIHAMSPFQIDGRFDAERYEEVLRLQGMNKTSFEEGMRVDLASMQVQSGVSGTFEVTDTELDRVIAIRNQRREVTYAVLSIGPYLEAVDITDDDLSQWYETNSSRFVAPEEARAAYVELDVAALAEEQSVDEDVVRRRYDEQRERFVNPAVRRASHLLVRVALDGDEAGIESARASAQSIYDEINSGTIGFDDAMDRASTDTSGTLEAGDLGPVTPGMMDDSFESALYALSGVGAISQPVRTDFGFHLIRLDGEDPGGTKAFEEVRDELLADVQRERAEGIFYELADQLATIAYENPDSLEPVAEQLGLSLQESDWFSRESGEDIARFPRVRDAAFGPEVLDQRLNSQLIELSPSHVVVLRMAEHRPSHERVLDEVREEALEVFTRERAEEALERAAKDLFEAVRAGEDLESLAAAVGAEWHPRQEIGRTGGETNPVIVRETFRLATPTPDGPTFVDVALDSDRRAIVALNAVIPGEPSEADSELRNVLRLALARQYGAGESQAMLRSLRSRADIKVFADRL